MHHTTATIGILEARTHQHEHWQHWGVPSCAPRGFAVKPTKLDVDVGFVPAGRPTLKHITRDLVLGPKDQPIG